MKRNAHNGGGAVYGLGLVGAFIYYMQHAQSVIDVLLGILKSIVWPAFLTYNLFRFLKL